MRRVATGLGHEMKSCCWWVEEAVLVGYWCRLMNQCELHFSCSHQPADGQWVWAPLGPLACACFVIRSRCRPVNKHLVQWSGSHEAHTTFKPLRTTELWSAPPSAVVWTSASPPSWQSEIRESTSHCLFFLSTPLETNWFLCCLTCCDRIQISCHLMPHLQKTSSFISTAAFTHEATRRASQEQSKTAE